MMDSFSHYSVRSLNAWYAVKGSVKNRFRRFGTGLDMEMATSAESVHFDNTGKGFDNPMYGATLQASTIETQVGASLICILTVQLWHEIWMQLLNNKY